jgi:hypothetical protein
LYRACFFLSSSIDLKAGIGVAVEELMVGSQQR